MKTLDGLMRYLAKRLAPKRYQALIRTAALQGLGLRDYVGRRVLKMVEEKYAARRSATERVDSITGAVLAAAEKAANEETA